MKSMLPFFHFQRLLISAQRRQTVAISLAGLVLLLAAAGGLWAAHQGTPQQPTQMAAMLPQGALLTIESRDFAELLKLWNDSPQKAAWLKSDNYSVFSNSRLFGRLGDAQNEFAQAAGLQKEKVGADFLTQVAGTDSIFAWYDIGKLEFLYITRMAPGAADRNPLLQMRGKFLSRQAGGQTFYVRTQADGNEGGEPQGEMRTVAFATNGDWLLLATREDLMAGALTLMDTRIAASPAPANLAVPEPLAREPWYAEAIAAAAKDPGTLRMTLNLAKIVPSPYFRSYWIQENITEMKQYRSAVCDLYTQAESFREERVLLPRFPSTDDSASPDLSELTSLLPKHFGAYRAIAAPTVDAALTGINEKLLQGSPGGYVEPSFAPDADLAVHPVGTAGDLELRIDAVPLAHPAKGSELAALREALETSSLTGMMTVSRTNDPVDGIWVPFQSALVLSSSRDWNAVQMQSALKQALQAHVTVGGLGLQWTTVKSKTGSYDEVSDARPLEIATRGRICILADNPDLMQEMLSHLTDATKSRKQARKSGSNPEPNADAQQPTSIAGFDLAQERASFTRWSGLVDRINTDVAAGETAGYGAPGFFSRNMRSLADTFAALGSERIVERRDGALTRQTVTYAWLP